MLKKIVLTCSFVLTTLCANAALITKDLHTAGDGLITYDTLTNLEWLDLTETRNRSYDDVSGQLGAGGDFSGWSYATFSQIDDFYKKFGFTSVFFTYAPNSPEFVASWNLLVNSVGDISSIDADQSKIFDVLYGTDFVNGPDFVSFTINRLWFADGAPVGGLTRVENYELLRNQNFPNMASFLVRPAEVPVPATAWLFGSGLVGLGAVARRRIAGA